MLINTPLHTGVIGDDSDYFDPIAGSAETELARLIARLPKFGPVYRGFNQGTKQRHHYACVIVSWLRSYFSLFPMTDFEGELDLLCDHMEKKGLWDPKVGGYVGGIGVEFVSYMNSRYPKQKVWMTRIKDGSSVMNGCAKRDIPVITAYYTGKSYSSAKEDGEISEKESSSLLKGSYGHCITITGIGPMWIYRELQDNYEGRKGNTYKVFGFPILKKITWFPNCFYVLLPQDVQPVRKKVS